MFELLKFFFIVLPLTMIRISGPMLKSSLQHLLMSTQQQNVFHNNCVFVCIMHHFGLMAHESWRMEKTKWKRFCCCFNQHWKLRALEASSGTWGGGGVNPLLPIVVLKRKGKKIWGWDSFCQGECDGTLCQNSY